MEDIYKIFFEDIEKNWILGICIKKEVIKLGLYCDFKLDFVFSCFYIVEELECIDLFVEEIVNEKMIGVYYIFGEIYFVRDLFIIIFVVSVDFLVY